MCTYGGVCIRRNTSVGCGRVQASNAMHTGAFCQLMTYLLGEKKTQAQSLQPLEHIRTQWVSESQSERNKHFQGLNRKSTVAFLKLCLHIKVQ